MLCMLNCLAPAKLNLFLHIIGRRTDGYHLIQTVFQMLNWGDKLSFQKRYDGKIFFKTTLNTENTNIVFYAAKLLQQLTSTNLGVSIELEKNVPVGAGLGGGSSDAATTLLALNYLWNTNLSRDKLKILGLKLGADVPFFIHGMNAFAENIGENLSTIHLPKRYFIIVTPPINILTAKIFAAKNLTRNSVPVNLSKFIKINGFDYFGRNDMQSVVVERYAEVAQILKELSYYAPARITGSGGSVFSIFKSRETALKVAACLSNQWKIVVTKSLDLHPLYRIAS